MASLVIFCVALNALYKRRSGTDIHETRNAAKPEVLTG